MAPSHTSVSVNTLDEHLATQGINGNISGCVTLPTSNYPPTYCLSPSGAANVTSHRHRSALQVGAPLIVLAEQNGEV